MVLYDRLSYKIPTRGRVCEHIQKFVRCSIDALLMNERCAKISDPSISGKCVRFSVHDVCDYNSNQTGKLLKQLKGIKKYFAFMF